MSVDGTISDGYIGSGKKFIKEYNEEPTMWDREILEYVINENDILDVEQKYLDKLDFMDNLCLNINPIAGGGWDFAHQIPEIVEKRNSAIRSGWENGRIIYNKGVSWEDAYTPKQLINLKEGLKKGMIKYNRNRGERGMGIKNSNSKIVIIEYLHGNLKFICLGSIRKWHHGKVYAKYNDEVWRKTYLNKGELDNINVNDYIKYTGQTVDKKYLEPITDNKLILTVPNRSYMLFQHGKYEILLDKPLTEFKKNVYGATGKKFWVKKKLTFDEFNKLKEKIKIWNGGKISKSEVERNS